MSPRTELFYFGVITLILFLAVIVIPYLRRKRDLLLPSNFFLGGATFFISVSAIDSSYTPQVLGFISRFTRQDYHDYFWGVAYFFFGFGFAYIAGRRLSKAIANRAFVRWPPISRQILWFMLALSVALSLGVIFKPNIVGLGQLVFQIAIKISAMTVVLAFVAWYYDRQNPVWLAFLIGTLGMALVVAVLTGGGRRNFVGTLFAIPIAYYWLRLRYISPQRVVVLMSVTAVVVFLLVGAYSTVRRDRTEGAKRDVAFSINALRQIPNRFGTVPWGQMMGQRSVECSLNAGRIYRRAKDRSLLHSIKVVLCAPIPRALWTEKPKGLGAILPKDAGSPYRSTWGPGIVGHGYYDGGLPVLILYGVLVGIMLRTLDNIVINNSNNPFVLGILAAVSAHLFGWLRGDIGTFTIQIIGGIAAGVMLGIAGRLLFGTQPRRFQVQIPQPAGH